MLIKFRGDFIIQDIIFRYNMQLEFKWEEPKGRDKEIMVKGFYKVQV